MITTEIRMGLVSPELSLDLKPSFLPETVNGFLKEVAVIADASEKLDKVDHFLRRLEDEMNKIEIFKRELPLCMLLLKHAILVLKQESTQFRTKNAHQPVLEEFIPMRKDSDDVNSQINHQNNHSNRTDEADSSRDKKDWMSSVQLWSADNFPASIQQNCHHNQTQTLVSENQKEDNERSKYASDNTYDPCKILTGSKGFVPMIHSYPNHTEITRKVEENVGVSGLSLLIPGIKRPKEDALSNGFNSRLVGGRRASCSSSPANGEWNLRGSHQQSAIRKQRRCWSSELHRRFVNALTQLGGPQVATPKQIRELMQVDGLTNDEVKSHLQKYRLHTQRWPNNTAVSTNETGNRMATSWGAQDQCTDSSKPSNSQSGSPEGPLHFPAITGGDSMEDEDDEKSESYSWRGHVHRTGKDDL